MVSFTIQPNPGDTSRLVETPRFYYMTTDYHRYICPNCGHTDDDPQWAFRMTRLQMDGRVTGYEFPVCDVCGAEMEERRQK